MNCSLDEYKVNLGSLIYICVNLFNTICHIQQFSGAAECTRGIHKPMCSVSYFQLKGVYSAAKQFSNAHIAICSVISKEKPCVPRPFAQKLDMLDHLPDCTDTTMF